MMRETEVQIGNPGLIFSAKLTPVSIGSTTARSFGPRKEIRYCDSPRLLPNPRPYSPSHGFLLRS